MTPWMKRETNSLLILTYHRITDKPDLEDPLKVSVSNFENQIRHLKNNYKIISGKQLADIIKKYDIKLVPTVITVGDKVYKDTIELPVDKFYDLLKNSPDRPVSAPPGRKDFYLKPLLRSLRQMLLSANRFMRRRLRPRFRPSRSLSKSIAGLIRGWKKHARYITEATKDTAMSSPR